MWTITSSRDLTSYTGNNLVLPFPSAALDDLIQVEQIMVDDVLLGEVRRCVP
jgi:hypothetical protein